MVSKRSKRYAKQEQSPVTEAFVCEDKVDERPLTNGTFYEIKEAEVLIAPKEGSKPARDNGSLAGLLSTPWYKHAVYLFLIVVASIIDVLAYTIFVQPNSFLPGGAWGIAAIIVHYVPVLPFGVYLLLLNIPLIIWGWKQMDLRFALYTVFTMVLQSILLVVLEGR